MTYKHFQYLDMFCSSSATSTSNMSPGEQLQNQHVSSISLEQTHRIIYGNESCAELRQFPVDAHSTVATASNNSLPSPSTLVEAHVPEVSVPVCALPVETHYNFSSISQVMPVPLTNYPGDMGSSCNSTTRGRSKGDTKSVRKRKASKADACSEKVKQTKVEQPASGAQERTRDPTKWKRNVAKFNRNSGKEYLSARGKIVPEKIFNPDPKCCHLAPKQQHCCQFQKIPEEERRAIFDEFYQMADYNLQNSLLFGLISKLERKRVRRKKVAGEKIPVESRRSFTFKYRLRRANGVELPVCKVAFTRVFGINQKRVETARHGGKGVSEHVSKFCPPIDMRGKHGNRKVIPEEEKERIRRHIEGLRIYLRAKRKGSYQVITAAKSIAELYRLYAEECEKEGRECPKEYLYRDIFNKEYSITFQSTSTDP